MGSLHKVMVWIVDSKKESVLLLHTLPERGSIWQPVTGWIDSGESPEEAALREVKEETGILISEKPLSLQYELKFVSRHQNKEVSEGAYWVKCPLSRAGLPLSVYLDGKEHDNYRWISLDDPNEVLSLLSFEGNREAFHCLLKAIAS